jgi:hypothetical protein
VLSRHGVETIYSAIESHVDVVVSWQADKCWECLFISEVCVLPSLGSFSFSRRPSAGFSPPTPLECGPPFFQFRPGRRTPRGCGDRESRVYAPSSHFRPWRSCRKNILSRCCLRLYQFSGGGTSHAGALVGWYRLFEEDAPSPHRQGCRSYSRETQHGLQNYPN